jgi:TRAP-type C4-dicarboxylate transport system permease large subunit
VICRLSGTAIADAAGLGTIEIKAMRDKGYNLSFSVSVTRHQPRSVDHSASLPFIIYATLAGVSVSQLFLAGITGVVMAILMMLTVAYYAHKNKWGDVAFEWTQIGKALVVAVVVGFPLAMWGAISSGCRSATRSASACCCCSSPTGSSSSAP